LNTNNGVLHGAFEGTDQMGRARDWDKASAIYGDIKAMENMTLI